jgi:hypothetical protein
MLRMKRFVIDLALFAVIANMISFIELAIRYGYSRGRARRFKTLPDLIGILQEV